MAHYLNFINPLRASLLLTTKEILVVLGYQSFLASEYTLRMQDGSAVRMVYSCIGYGVMSFWAAFVYANTGGWQKKLKWILGGWVALWVINVTRVSLLLLATSKKWLIPFAWDHHTWFNIAAYTLIFCMIYFYDRSAKKITQTPKSKTDLLEIEEQHKLTELSH